MTLARGKSSHLGDRKLYHYCRQEVNGVMMMYRLRRVTRVLYISPSDTTPLTITQGGEAVLVTVTQVPYVILDIDEIRVMD